MTIWMIASSVSELWVHFLPPLCVFMFLFLVFHRRGLTLYECFWGAFPIGYFFVFLVVFLVCAIIGHVNPFAVRVVYVVFSVFAVILLGLSLQKIRNQTGYLHFLLLELRREFCLNVLLLISTAFFGAMFYTHMLYKDSSNNLYSGGSVWADFAFHLNIINSFLYGENKNFSLFSKLKSQIFSGHSMSYPFIPDFHATSLMSLGKYDITQSSTILNGGCVK